MFQTTNQKYIGRRQIQYHFLVDHGRHVRENSQETIEFPINYREVPADVPTKSWTDRPVLVLAPSHPMVSQVPIASYGLPSWSGSASSGFQHAMRILQLSMLGKHRQDPSCEKNGSGDVTRGNFRQQFPQPTLGSRSWLPAIYVFI